MDEEIQNQIDEIQNLIIFHQKELKKFNDSKVLNVLSGTFVCGLFVAFGAFAADAGGFDAQVATNIAGVGLTMAGISAIPLFVEGHTAVLNEHAIMNYNDHIDRLKSRKADLLISRATKEDDFSFIDDNVLESASKSSLQELSGNLLSTLQISDKDVEVDESEKRVVVTKKMGSI